MNNIQNNKKNNKNNENNIIKKYSNLEIITLAIGGMIGGGIFLLNGIVVNDLKQYSYISWIIGLIICLTFAFSFILISKEYSQLKGGTSIYPQLLFKNKYSKIISTIIIIFGYVILTSVYSISLGSYLGKYLNQKQYAKIYAIITIIFTLIFNYIPEKKFFYFQKITVILKCLMFFILILLGYFYNNQNYNDNNNINYTIRQNNYISKNQLSYLPISIILLYGISTFLSYEGFEMISNTTYKMKNPKKDIPITFITSILIVGFIYANLSYVTNKHLGNQIHKFKFTSLLHLTEKLPIISKYGSLFVLIICILSNITAINSTLFTNNYIIDTFTEYNLPTNGFKHFIDTEIKLPLLSKRRKLLIWIISFISCLFVFCPILLITNLGSILFLIIFSIISYCAIILIQNKQKKNKKIEILNININHSISKIICVTSILISIIGIIYLIYQTQNMITNHTYF